VLHDREPEPASKSSGFFVLAALAFFTYRKLRKEYGKGEKTQCIPQNLQRTSKLSGQKLLYDIPELLKGANISKNLLQQEGGFSHELVGKIDEVKK
jgi:hypothetical protein